MIKYTFLKSPHHGEFKSAIFAEFSKTKSTFKGSVREK